MTDTIDVKALRKSLEWTQAQLADFLGVDRSSVAHMEAGREPIGPTRKLLEQLKANPPETTQGEPAQ